MQMSHRRGPTTEVRRRATRRSARLSQLYLLTADPWPWITLMPDEPRLIQRIRVNTGRARSATSRYSPKILSQPAEGTPDLAQRNRVYLVTAVLPHPASTGPGVAFWDVHADLEADHADWAASALAATAASPAQVTSAAADGVGAWWHFLNDRQAAARRRLPRDALGGEVGPARRRSTARTDQDPP
jgi:hypothetical protein